MYGAEGASAIVSIHGRTEERLNTLKTFLLMAGLTALLMVAGQALGGQNGLVVAVIFALLMNLGSYWFSDKIVLKMTGAHPVEPGSAPELEGIIARLSASAGIPTPRLFVVDDPSPNAFATGRNPEHGVVAVHSGLLRILDREQLEGVLAHELAHIKHRDILISAVAATMAGAISSLAAMARWGAIFFGRDDDRGGGLGWLFTMIVAPIAAMLIQLAVSRSREYAADAEGARLSGRPAALASALASLEQTIPSIPHNANPATAHMYIISPLLGGGLASLFATHPSTKDRIARLMELDHRMGGAGSARAF